MPESTHAISRDTTMTPEDELHAIKYVIQREQSVVCDNDAPHIAVRRGDRWTVYQGCCNSWTCSRCGLMRASTEYHRIRAGVQILNNMSVPIWFVTLTAPGAGTSVSDAEESWYNGTMKTLNALRNQYKRAGGDDWYYAAVTERQRRGHPHAHYMLTAVPADVALAEPGARLRDGRINQQRTLQSDWLSDRCERNGLGTVFDMQAVTEPSQVAAYISKYLFKSLLDQQWPKNWRRVRYSRSWYKPDAKSADEAIALLGANQWDYLGSQGDKVYTRDEVVLHHWQAWRAPNIKLKGLTEPN